MQGPQSSAKPSRGNPARFETALDVTSRVPAGGLPGRVLVSSPVWLCCVYPAVRQLDRIDQARESDRLDRLLRAASEAWRLHGQSQPGLVRQCVFAYNAGEEGDRIESLPIRIVPVEACPDGFTTRLEIAA